MKIHHLLLLSAISSTAYAWSLPFPGAANAEQMQSSQAPAPVQAQPNSIRGRVTYQDGRPFPGAEMTMIWLNAGGVRTTQTTKTDANGVYTLRLSGNFGANVYGLAPLTVEGQAFKIYLDPVETFGSEFEMVGPGLIKNFVLKLSGLKKVVEQTYYDPNRSSSYYGAYIKWNFPNYLSKKPLPGSSPVTMTLTPLGPLADGSPAQPLVFQRTVNALGTREGNGPLEESSTLHDIPLGRYRITGTVTMPDGTQSPLRFGRKKTPSVDVGFKPEATGYGAKLDDPYEFRIYAPGED